MEMVLVDLCIIAIIHPVVTKIYLKKQ